MKNVKRILSFILSFALIFSICNNHLFYANAELSDTDKQIIHDDKKDLVNKVELLKLDTKTNKWVALKNGDGLSFGEDFKIRYFFKTLYPSTSTTNPSNFTPGDSYWLPNIPLMIEGQSGEDFKWTAKLEDGVTPLGEAAYLYKNPDVATNNNMMITFDEGLKEATQVDNAWIEFTANLNQNACGNGTSAEIDFGISSDSKFLISLLDNIPTPPTIEKDGEYDETTQQINWKIKVTEGTLSYQNKMEIKDTIGDNQEFVNNSFKVYQPGDATGTPVADLNTDKNTFAYTYQPTNKNNNQWVIEYATKFKPTAIVKNDKLTNGDITLNAKNDVELYEENNSTVISKATKVKEIPAKYQWINKEVITTDTTEGTVTWQVKVNANGYTFDNVHVYDKVVGVPVNTPTSNITYDLGMNSPISGSGIHSEGDFTFSTNDQSATTTISEGGQTYAMKIDLGTISGNQDIIITYKTKISNYADYIQYNQPTLENTVWMDFDWPNYNGDGSSQKIGGPTLTKNQPMSSGVIAKSNGTYNPSTHEITWTITANANQSLLTNSYVLDQIGEGHEYVGFKDLTIEGSPVTLNNFDEPQANNQVKFNFGNTLNGKKAEFKVITKLTDPNYYESNIKDPTTFKNMATIFEQGIKKAEATGTVKPVNTVFTKYNPTYNYTNQTLSWVMDINQDKMALKAPIVVDNISKGLLLDTTTLMLNDIAIPKKVSDTDTKPYYTLDNQELKVYLSDFNTGDQKTTIKFDTKIDIENAVFVNDGIEKSFNNYNGNINIENTATLQKDGSENVLSTGDITINNQLLNKIGTQDKTNKGLIYYDIVINQPGITLPEKTVLDDIMSPGMRINLSTLELYEANVSADGKVIPIGDPIDNFTYETNILTDQNEWNVDVGSTHLSITLPEKPQQKTFILKYSVIVTNRNKDNYKNDIKMAGLNPKSEGTGVDFSKAALFGSEGGTLVKTSRIQILKWNMDKSEALSGAVFALSYDGHIIDTQTTDENGQVIFDYLEVDVPYTITEIEAPFGYSISETHSIDFTAPAVGVSNTKVFEFLNDKLKANIEFKVMDKYNKGVANASFGLWQVPKEHEEPCLDEIELDQATSQEDGQVDFDGVVEGQYHIRQTKAQEGYKISDAVFECVVDEEGKITDFYNIDDKDKGFVITVPNDKIIEDIPWEPIIPIPPKPENPKPEDPIIPEKPVLPDNSTDIDKPELPKPQDPIIKEEIPVNKEENKNSSLVNTGDNSMSLTAAVGALILSSLSLVVLRKKKSHR